MRPAILTVVFASLFAASIAYADSPATMRLDYFHSGNAESELFSLDQVVV